MKEFKPQPNKKYLLEDTPISELICDTKIIKFEVHDKDKLVGDNYVLIENNAQIKDLKIAIYKKLPKIYSNDCPAPIENYCLMIQHSLYGYIMNIAKDCMPINEYIKYGNTFRMQQLLPEECKYLLNPKSYQVYFCFIGQNNEVLGNSFAMIFPPSTKIIELKDCVKMKLCGLKSITWNNQKYDIDKDEYKMYLFKIDDSANDDVSAQLPQDLRDLNDYHDPDVLDYILHMEMEEYIAFIAIQLPFGICKAKSHKLAIKDHSQ